MPAPEQPLFEFSIIGAQKAASTYLQRALSDHPEVWMPDGETDCFEDVIYTPELASELFRSFRNKAGGRLLGFKRPELLSQRSSAGRLHHHAPDARIIAVLRDPVERAVAAYYHYMRYATLPVVDPEEGLTRIFAGDWDEKYKVARLVREYSMYGKALRNWTALYPQDKILIVIQEELLKNKREGLQEVYRFLEIDDGHLSGKLNKRSQAVIYSLPRIRFFRLIEPFYFEWLEDGFSYRHRFGAFSRLLWRAFCAVDRLVLKHLLPDRKPKLSKKLRATMLSYFEKDVLDLEKVLGRKADFWENNKKMNKSAPNNLSLTSCKK